MAKKREVHFSRSDQVFIMKECGLPETEAMLIASITEGFTFNMLDALSLAFNAIKKGVKAECL